MYLKRLDNFHSHRGKTALRKPLQEHEQKAALSSEIRKNRNKPRISKISATCTVRICDFAHMSQALTTQPRMLKLAKN